MPRPLRTHSIASLHHQHSVKVLTRNKTTLQTFWTKTVINLTRWSHISQAFSIQYPNCKQKCSLFQLAFMIKKMLYRYHWISTFFVSQRTKYTSFKRNAVSLTKRKLIIIKKIKKTFSLTNGKDASSRISNRHLVFNEPIYENSTWRSNKCFNDIRQGRQEPSLCTKVWLD